MQIWYFFCSLQIPRQQYSYAHDNDDGASLVLVDKFCHMGDMLSVDGDANAAVQARLRKGWNKFRQLA